MEKAFLLARRENPLLLFRVTYARTYRVSGEALPGELEIGDVGRDRNDEVHCVRVNHSFPHVVQLGLQSWKKKREKAKQMRGRFCIDRRPADDQLWKKLDESKVFPSARLYTRATCKTSPFIVHGMGGKGEEREDVDQNIVYRKRERKTNRRFDDLYPDFDKCPFVA